MCMVMLRMRPLSKANSVAPAEVPEMVTAQRAGPAPGGHLHAEPLDRFLPAIVFGVLADLLGEGGVGGFHMEIGRSIGGAQGSHRADQHDSDRGA